LAAGQAFIDRFVAEMDKRQPGVLLNANIESGLAQAVAGTLARPGVEALTGGAPMQAAGFCYPHTVLTTTAAAFRADPALQAEHFGPVTLVVRCASLDDLLDTLAHVEGNLTASVQAAEGETADAGRVYDVLRDKVGRLIWNGYPTGVEVVHAMQHGGPYPATTAPNSTSVGLTAIKRFMRPLAFQNLPDALLPDALKDGNPLGIWRIVDNEWRK
jgi:NADP-dependent aldehyde dehydrogenase